MKIKLVEVFSSIQGEGQYTGTPMFFIRLSGCTRSCQYCDTKYHTEGEEVDIEEVVKIIQDSKMDFVCWTGGEPLLQKEIMYQIIQRTRDKQHHVETNGDLLTQGVFNIFDYLAISPKDKETAKKVWETIKRKEMASAYDIKVVTDLKTVGIDMLEYATMLMPLTGQGKKDKETMKGVWMYAIEKNLKYSGRLHQIIFNNKKGI